MSTQNPPSRVVWFEIPALDLERATRFYETIFDQTFLRHAWGPGQIAVFPYEKPNIGGSITCEPGFTPSPNGTLVHLNADPSLDAVLARVEAAGGTIVEGRTALPPGMGFGAKIRDTEGNTVGLHSML